MSEAIAEESGGHSVRRLRHSILALGVVQAANLAIPLVTQPYLTRTLGVVAYGRVAFVQIVMAYFILLTDYGFSWSATRKIAACREDKEQVSRIFCATWVSQWILASVSMAAVLIGVRLIPALGRNEGMFLAGLLLVLGNMLFPVWLLQGLERMKEVALIQVGGRMLALPLIFVLVRGPEDGLIAVCLFGAGPMAAGLMSMAWIRCERLVGFVLPSMAEVLDAFREGAGLFMSRVCISAYTTLNPILLAAAAGPEALAYFVLADKVRSAAQSGLAPLSQALFPRMSHLYQKNAKGAAQLLKRSMLLVLVVAGTISLGLWVVSDWAILFFGGAKFAHASGVLRWLAPLPLVIGFSNIFGVQVLLPNKQNRAFSAILIGASALSLALIWPMAKHWGAQGAARTSLITECFVTLAMGCYLWRRGYLDIFGAKK